MRLAALALVACSSARPLPPVRPMSIDDWIVRCRDRVEVARLAMVAHDKRFANGRLIADANPSNLVVRFDLQVEPDGYFSAEVRHGAILCSERDEPDSEWARNPFHEIVLSRNRRLHGDRAWIEGNRVSPHVAAMFRREMERALEACIVEARGVEKGPDSCDQIPK